MKKYWQTLTALAIATFLTITAPAFVHSQVQDSPDNPIQEVQVQATEAEAVEVVVDGQSLFAIPEGFGGMSAEQRSQNIAEQIEQFASEVSIPVESLQIGDLGGTIVIFSGNTIITSVTEADARAANTTPRELSYIYLEKIQEFVKQYRENDPVKGSSQGVVTDSWFKKVWNVMSSLTMDRQDKLSYRRAIGYTIIFTVVFVSLWFLINIVSSKIYEAIEHGWTRKISDIKIQNTTIFNANQVSLIVLSILKKLFSLVKLAVFIVYISLILSFFPWTRKVGSEIINYSKLALNTALESLIDYMPNFFVIVLIGIISSYLIRFSKFIFSEIGKESISFPGFYPEWAEPTYRIVEVGIIALALVMAAPYFPGFGSPAFQGVSLFLGVLFSLGSSTALSNAVAGIILIYTRAFQMGDRIEVEDTQGDVVEKSLLVTRILTDDNVIVTLPNSNLLSTRIFNYNAPIRDHNIPVAFTVNVHFGYDVPWQTVYEVVKNASEKTPYILQDPPSKVLHLELGEFSVKYEIENYTNQPSKREDILSEFQKYLRDSCNDAGIEILSPHYSAIRDGNQSTVPESSLPKERKNKGFQINPLGNLFQIDMQWGNDRQNSHNKNDERSNADDSNGNPMPQNSDKRS